MPSLPTDATDLPGLALLAGLAIPLWLVRPDDGGPGDGGPDGGAPDSGTVVWLNRAARALLDPDGRGGRLRFAPAAPRSEELARSREPVERLAVLRDDAGRAMELAVRVGPAPGSPLLLVEAPADSCPDLKARAMELAAARDLAEAANRRKSDYIHHLSHELRTPLTAVIGFAEILRDRLAGPPGSPRHGEAAAQIVAAGGYMLELINNLLDLARIDAGRLELHEEDCLPALIANATLAMMAARAGQAGVELAARLPDDLPMLRADPSLVRQMLTNLVGNALKFTAAGGRVTVAAERDGAGGLTLLVADDGRGMPPDRIPQALTAFAQIHDRTHDPMTVPQHGSGLGLPLTAALMDLHGGSIAIDSTPGRGTTVRLRFPPERVVAAAEPAGTLHP